MKKLNSLNIAQSPWFVNNGVARHEITDASGNIIAIGADNTCVDYNNCNLMAHAPMLYKRLEEALVFIAKVYEDLPTYAQNEVTEKMIDDGIVTLNDAAGVWE